MASKVSRLRSIGVAQTCPTPGDVGANLSEHLRLVRLAAQHGARLVLFPELSLTGYELDVAEASAMSAQDQRLASLLEAASSQALIIIAGAPVRFGPHLHIGAFVFDPRRGISVYTKQRLGTFGESARCDGNLPPPEPTIFQPGSLDPLVELDDCRAAVAICADIGDPRHAQRAVDRGATGYLASMFVIPSEFEADSSRLRSYAMEHSMLVALANFGSPSGGLAAAGRSSIWSESGELLAQMPERGAGVAVVTRSANGWCASVARLDAV